MVNPFLTLAWFCTFDVVVIQGRIFLISKWISEIPLSSVVLYIFTFSVKHLNWKHVFKGRSLKLVLVIVVQSLSPTLHDDPMNCSMPGFPVLHYFLELLKFMSIESLMPFNHLILCCPFFSCLQSFPASGSFPMSLLFTSGGQSIGASASASVLPTNIQGWFLLELTG